MQALLALLPLLAAAQTATYADVTDRWELLDAHLDAGHYEAVYRNVDRELLRGGLNLLGADRPDLALRLGTVLALQHWDVWLEDRGEAGRGEEGDEEDLATRLRRNTRQISELLAGEPGAGPEPAAGVARTAIRMWLVTRQPSPTLLAPLLQAWARAAINLPRLMADPRALEEVLLTLELTVTLPDYDATAVVWPVFQLCDLYDRAGDPDLAFRYCAKANAVVHSLIKPGRVQSLLSHLAFVESNFLGALPHPTTTTDEATILFIIGMPRVGSTLLEQMLDALPDVHSLGESGALRDHALAEVDRYFEEDLRGVPGEPRDAGFAAFQSPEVFARVQAALRAAIRAEAGGSIPLISRCSDFAYAQLAARLLPEARFVHMRRHRGDVSLSVFKGHFSGWEGGNAWAFSPDDIRRYWDQYERTMAVVEADPALEGRLLRVDYEDLVTDTEATMRRVVAFAGARWDEACLRPERHSRAAASMSKDAVRRPISAKSVGGWRRFREHMPQFGVPAWG